MRDTTDAELLDDLQNSVLGGILLDPDQAGTVLAALDEDCFPSAHHRGIFGAIRRLHARGDAIDEVTVLAELGPRKNGVGQLVRQLVEVTPTSSNVLHYVRSLREHSVRSALVEIGRRAASGGNVTVCLADVDSLRRQLEEVGGRRGIEALSLGDALAKYEAARSASAVRSGIESLDSTLGGGLPVGQVTTLLGGPGSGKSELARQMVNAAARLGHPAVHVDVELGAARVLERHLSEESDIAAPRLRRPEGLSPDALRRMHEAGERLRGVEGVRILCPGVGVPLGELWAAVDSAIDGIGRDSPALVVLDSSQRLAAGIPLDQERMRVQAFFREVEAFARPRSVAVVLTSEQKRMPDGRMPSPEDVLTSGAESRAVEYTSDVVLGLVRTGKLTDEVAGDADGERERIVRIVVAKNRPGGTEGYLPDELVFVAPCWQMRIQPSAVGDLEAEIRELLADGQTRTAEEIRARVKKRKTVVRATLREMEERGVVRQVAHGEKLVGWMDPSSVPGPDRRGAAQSVPMADRSGPKTHSQEVLL